MQYVCPACNSDNWVANGKNAECKSCGKTTLLEAMKKAPIKNAQNLNEVVPDAVSQSQNTIQINE